MVPEEILQQILSLNSLDVELYNYAQDLFLQEQKHLMQTAENFFNRQRKNASAEVVCQRILNFPLQASNLPLHNLPWRNTLYFCQYVLTMKYQWCWEIYSWRVLATPFSWQLLANVELKVGNQKTACPLPALVIYFCFFSFMIVGEK